MTTVQFSGVTFDDTTASGFHLSRLTGWDDAAPARYAADNRPQANGTFRPGTIYRNARVVSVEGTWTGSDLASAYAARYQLAALQADGVESPFVVTDLLGSKSVTAGITTAPVMDDGLYAPFFSFAFDVVAADPFRYGSVVTGSTGVPTPSSGLVWPLGSSGSGLYFDWGTPGNPGQVSLSNAGSAASWPSFTVGGGLSNGFSLTWVPTGDQLVFNYPIPDGSSVNVNSRTGRVTLDGSSDVTGFLTVANWWSVSPGQTGQVQFLPLGSQSGSPSLSASLSPAYV